MAGKSYSLEFDGYWREENAGGVPDKSGVYCVYACTYSKPKGAAKGTVSLRVLIYIGEAADCRDRIAKHERKKDWKKHPKSGEELCYSFAPVASADRERVEAALIFQHKPPENDEYKDSFPFDETTIKTSGENKFLEKQFTVERTE